MDIVERLIAYKDRQRSRKDRDLMSDAANEIERLHRLLDVCREAMRVTQRFHPDVTDWRGVIAAIDHEIGAKEPATP